MMWMVQRLMAGVQRRQRTPWEVARLTSRITAASAGAKHLGEYFPFDDALPWEKVKDTRSDEEKQAAWEEASQMLSSI